MKIRNAPNPTIYGRNGVDPVGPKAGETLYFYYTLLVWTTERVGKGHRAVGNKEKNGSIIG